MIIYIFIIGILIGSFLNVCIYRLPRHESIVVGSSHCTKCGVSIKWYDLIPVLSYLVLGGKCRNCKDKISIRYPVIELINAIFYTILYYLFKNTILTIILCMLTSMIIVILMMTVTKKQNI